MGSRGAQKSALAGVLYDKRTEAELGQLLEQLTGAAAGLEPVQAAVVREAHRCVGGAIAASVCRQTPGNAQGRRGCGFGMCQGAAGLEPLQAAVVREAHMCVGAVQGQCNVGGRGQSNRRQQAWSQCRQQWRVRHTGVFVRLCVNTVLGSGVQGMGWDGFLDETQPYRTVLSAVDVALHTAGAGPPMQQPLRQFFRLSLLYVSTGACHTSLHSV